MGTDKALLRVGGETLLERALALARGVTPMVSIVGQREKFAVFGPVVEDAYTERGPLAGIHAALSSSKSELNLMLAVDTPFLTPQFLRYLVEQAAQCTAVVTAPRVREHNQPLCAVYRPAFAQVAEASLRQGRNRIDPLFAEVTTRILGSDEIQRLAFDPGMFDNLNTPEDWERAAGTGKLS